MAVHGEAGHRHHSLITKGNTMIGGVRVEGLNGLVRDLQSLGLELDDLKGAFSEIAQEGARLASSFAPKRSGALAASVRGNKAKNKAVVMAGRARVPYAGAINYGWPKRNIAPAMFMQRADEAMRPKALSALDAALVEAVKRRGLA
jgi:hypothetical protein